MIRVIDYGLGNVQAFLNVYSLLGIDAASAKVPSDLDDATHLILPGVGSFDLAMQLFVGSGMKDAVENLVINKGMPVLGVCVGMQILASSSEEGTESGLGWIQGTVKKIESYKHDDVLQLPHMGWNDAIAIKKNPLLAASEFYFLHSYYFVPFDEENIIAEFDYGTKMVCAVSKGNIFGVQFHPEKSHHNGSLLLKNFSNT
jgi:glutamine amidotransferase|tara:strand:- start:478 stop:1080 length:603 start_codon:yes stop_codon:yes gene_type:complete